MPFSILSIIFIINTLFEKKLNYTGTKQLEVPNYLDLNGKKSCR